MKTLRTVLWTSAALAGLALVFVPAPAQADICHLDDVIIDGSLCVGLDCVCNRSFGFDTIVLSENNLRIFFEDTSVAAAFPTNDWRIRINDSSNGGGSYFAVEDSTAAQTPFRVDAGADTDSLRVDSQGDVGIGTGTPALELSVRDGDSPGLRLEQDGSSGFTPQTWDVVGNETNFFIRDVTNGSKLPFRIRPDAPGNSIMIDADGDIGMGTASPASSLHVNRATNNLLRLENTDAGGAARFIMFNGDDVEWRLTNAANGAFRIAEQAGATGTEFEMDAAGNVTITGQLVTQGPQCPLATPCDGVFRLGDELDSIEAHAERMWENSYLPAVGPTEPGKPINLTERTGRMLNELEKAHIYIEQLHRRLEGQQEKVERLELMNAEMAELRERMASLEAVQPASLQ